MNSPRSFVPAFILPDLLTVLLNMDGWMDGLRKHLHCSVACFHNALDLIVFWQLWLFHSYELEIWTLVLDLALLSSILSLPVGGLKGLIELRKFSYL
jgi:hypothetical protein